MSPVTLVPNTVDPTLPSVHLASSGHYFAALPDQTTANSYAALMDIIISNSTKYQSFSAGMSGGNSRLLLGDYDKSIQSDQAVSFPENWYAHNPALIHIGNRILVFSKYYEMQADHPAGVIYNDARGFTASTWKEWVAKDHWQNVADANARYTGAPLNLIYYDSMSQFQGAPISWQDGHAYTKTEFNNISYQVGDEGMNRRPTSGMWVWGNGLSDANAYMGASTNPANPTGSTQDLLPHLDGGVMENWIRSNGGSMTAFPNNTTLEQCINSVKSASARGKFMWFVVNINNATAGGSGFTPVATTPTQVRQWWRFTMCTYLIGNDGNAWYEFVESTSVLPWTTAAHHVYYDMVLGAPIDTFSTASAYKNATTGLYTRNYDQGTVYVNNTGTAVTFNPGTGYKQVDGTVVSGTVTLGGHDGLMLMHPAVSGGTGGGVVSRRRAVQGMVDRDGNSIPTAYQGHMGGMGTRIDWKNLQNTNTTTLSGTDLAVADTAVNNANNLGIGVKLRIYCGKEAPTWLKTSVGTFKFADGQDDALPGGGWTTWDIPKFWTTTYKAAFDKLMQLMAARYDGVDVIMDIAIANTMTKYAEPMQRWLNVPENRAEMVGGGNGFAGTNVAVPGAGYSNAGNIQAFKDGIDSAFTWWQFANVSVAWNPYQKLLSQTEAGITYSGSNQVYDTNDDATLSQTKALIDYCVQKFGDRFVRENNSVRQSFFTYDSQGKATGIATPTGSYGMMYTYLKSLGPPAWYQTASTGNDNTNPRIGDLDMTMDGIVNILKANAAEPPGDYTGRANDGQPDSSEYGPVNFDKWNQLLLGNPLPVIGGGSGGGGGGGSGGGSYDESTISTDTYTRTVAPGGLGNSDSGLAYTTSGTAGDYQVNGSMAVINVPVNSSRRAMLSTPSLQDFHCVMNFQWNELPVGDDNDLYLWARATTDGQNGYRIKVTTVAGTNAINMRLQKQVAGVTASIGNAITLSGSFVINTLYTADIRVTGINPTTVEGMLYKTSDGAPSAYMDSVNDTEATLQVSNKTAGYSFFIHAASTSGPSTASVDRFDTMQRTFIPTVNTAPSLDSFSPPDGVVLPTAVGANTLPVSFSATSSDIDGTVDSVSVIINNGATQQLTLTSGQWKKSITLSAGTYSVLWTVTDDVGAVTTVTSAFTVTATPAPVVPPTTGGGLPTTQPTVEYAVLHVTHDGTALGEVRGIDLRFGRYINNPGFISYDLHRTHQLAQPGYSEPNAVDFSLQRNGTEILAGEIIERTADTDTDLVSVQGNDWMNYLDQLVLPYDPLNYQSSDNFTRRDTDLKDIVEGLIQKVLNGYDNAIQISMNNSATGIQQDQHFVASDLNTLKQMIDTLADQHPGFEWEITPDKRFVMYTPQRTDQSIYRVDSTNVKQVHYGVQGVQASTIYGRGSGTSSSQAIRKYGNSLLARTYRARVQVFDFGTVSSRAMLQQLSTKKLTELGKQRLEFWITAYPRPGENIHTLVAPGQYLYIDWNDGYVQLQGWYRCNGYEFYVNAAGDEQVVFNLNTDEADV